MKFIKSKKALVLLAVTVVAVVAAVAGYAYWSSTGQGSGTATVGTSSNFDVAVSITPPAGGIVLGSDSAVSGTVTNNTTSSLQLNSVVVDSTASGTANGLEVTPVSGTCGAVANFTVSALAISGGAQVLAPGGAATFSGTLHMIDDPVNSQDGCKNAGLKLDVLAS